MRVIDLRETYRRLGRPWPHDELAVVYAAANRRGQQVLCDAHPTAPDRPVGLLATALPAASTLSAAIHLLHALPEGVRGNLMGELLETGETNAADALHCCHRALELDGLARGYTADDWLPVICDIAGPLLESARLDHEPPSLVRHTQNTVSWLSTSIARLDEDSPEAAAALADTLARLLAVWVFADGVRASARSSSG